MPYYAMDKLWSRLKLYYIEVTLIYILQEEIQKVCSFFILIYISLHIFL